MKKLIVAVLVGGILAVPQMGSAQNAEIEWTDSGRLALGQCFVGEAGWRNRTEHSAIAHVLQRNWMRFRATHPDASFESRVRRYCAVHRVRNPSPRQRWVRNLPWGPLVEDPGMPSGRVNWENFKESWDYVMETVRLFEMGLLEDPLPAAVHWGGSMDGAPDGGVLLTQVVESLTESGVVRLNNFYYRIDAERARRARMAREAIRAGRLAQADNS